MKKNLSNQFSMKAQYVTPSCNSVLLTAAQTVMLVDSYGNSGEAGGQGGYIDDTGEDY